MTRDSRQHSTEDRDETAAEAHRDREMIITLKRQNHALEQLRRALDDDEDCGVGTLAAAV